MNSNADAWQSGSVQEFLGLDDVETALVEFRTALVRTLRRLREEQGLTQQLLAERIGTHQTHVARMESGDASVSIDKLLATVLRLGFPPQRLLEVFSKGVDK